MPRQGSLVHLELHTGDVDRARGVYEQLCGWHPEPIGTPGGPYLALGMPGGLGGGLVESGLDRPLWLPYVSVDDIDRATERAATLGARILLDRREGPAGWRTVLSTPAGGELAFWQQKPTR